MSLAKQLFIVVSVLFLIIFSLNFLLSINNIKSYLETEAQTHAQDTATSLGLSLSPYMRNESDPTLETMINAIFDMGYYREIKLVNIDNKTLVNVRNDKVFAEVPAWFIARLPMQVATASSEISSGWNPSGSINVTVNPGYAYLKLYQQAKQTLLFSTLTLIFALVALSILLRYVLLPLQAINQLALTITAGTFATISPLPWTKEVRNVAISMNTMSKKLEEMIQTLTKKLKTLGQKVQQDELTGLQKKSSFTTDMKQLFIAETAAFIFIIKIDALATLAKEHGAEQIDTFLQQFSEKLQQLSAEYANEQVIAYRFFGAEFALLAKLNSRLQAEALAQALSNILTDLATTYQRTDIAHIGVTPFDALGSVDSHLAAAHEAYEQALLIGVNSYYIRQPEHNPRDVAAWKELVFNVINNQAYQVSYQGQVLAFADNAIILEDALTIVYDNGVAITPMGTFISIAEKYAKIVDLDQGIIKLVIQHIKTAGIKHAIAVSLSTRTVKHAGFRAWLSESLQQEGIAPQLIFSISAYAAAKEVETYREFFQFVHSLGAKVMLKRFETPSLTLDMVQQLHPDYIRLTRDLSNSIASDLSKRNFVITLQEAAKLLDVTLLAENTQDANAYTLLSELGLSGASR